MLMDFCFIKDDYAKINKVEQITMRKTRKDINNFKIIQAIV